MTHAAIIFRDGGKRKGNEKLGAIEEMQISLCSELVDQDASFHSILISSEQERELEDRKSETRTREIRGKRKTNFLPQERQAIAILS